MQRDFIRIQDDMFSPDLHIMQMQSLIDTLYIFSPIYDILQHYTWKL